MKEVRLLQPKVASELADTSGAADPWNLVASASSAVRRAISDFLSLETAARAEGRESTCGEALGRCLLWAPSLELGDDWEPKQDAPTVVEAAKCLASTAPSPLEVFDHHLEKGDFKGARRMLATPEISAHPDADKWSLRLDDTLKLATQRLSQELDHARAVLEGALASGYLTEAERGPLDTRLVSLSDSLTKVDQFGPARASIGWVHSEIEKFKSVRMEEARASATA